MATQPILPHAHAASPVRLLPGEQDTDQPEDGIALCLSGGGYRAMLFHLGALWRLNELGYLLRLKRVSSVSGGSITASVLAAHWSKLGFDQASGVAAEFADQVVRPVRSLAGRTIDIPAILAGFLSSGGVGGRTADAYRRHLLGDVTLQHLPDQPRFVFNATSLQSGVLWRFSKPYMRDWRVGEVSSPTVALAVAVAASAAYPPFLSPVRLDLRESDFVAGTGFDLQRAPYTTRVQLTDGGIYDNLGLETAWKRYRTILVSDGGGSAAAEGSPAGFWPLQTYRILNLLNRQVGALRKRQVIQGFTDGVRGGTYWGIAGHVADYRIAESLPCPAAATAALAAVETRLKRLDTVTQERLINWGYAICDVAMRKHVEPAAAPPAAFPYPSAGVG